MILVILGGVVAVNFVGISQGAQEDIAETQMNGFKRALKLYQLQVGTLPGDLGALREAPSGLSDPARWKGPYLEEDVPLDPWDNEYTYKPTGTGFEIRSAGPDRQEGSEDDIVVTAS